MSVVVTFALSVNVIVPTPRFEGAVILPEFMVSAFADEIRFSSKLPLTLLPETANKPTSDSDADWAFESSCKRYTNVPLGVAASVIPPLGEPSSVPKALELSSTCPVPSLPIEYVPEIEVLWAGAPIPTVLMLSMPAVILPLPSEVSTPTSRYGGLLLVERNP